MKPTRSDFLLFGALGSFPLPPGESRVGSDAACDICIRDDGILPTHAYLRADGDKLLIRPSYLDVSPDTPRAAITVEGSLVTGPTMVLPGQRIGIGSVQLTLQRGKELKAASPGTGKWARIALYSVLSTAALLLISFIYVRFVVLGEDSLRRRIKDTVHDTLGRSGDDVDVEKFDVRFWDGRIDISNLKIKERFDFQSAPSNFVSIPNIVVKFDAWAFILSWKRELLNLDITIDGDIGGHVPEIVLERSKTDGTLNIDDCIQKVNAGRAHRLPLTKLNAILTLKKGVVRLRDPFNNIAETSLENIDLALRLKGPGIPVDIEKCEMRVNAIPKPPELGTLSITGKIGLLDDVCALDVSKFSAESLVITMAKFDLARVFEHFGYAWEPNDANFKVVLGKPFDGRVEIDAPTPRDITIRGRVTSDSLISIKEEGKPSFGNISSDLKCDELHFIKEDKDGASFVPRNVNLTLKSWTHPSRRDPAFLTLSANGAMNPNTSTSTYLVELNCELKELLNTDVGQRLKLDGSLGGSLNGRADVIVDANNGLKIVAKFDGKDTYVNLRDLKDPSKPPLKQPIPLNFECIGNAKRDAVGDLDYIDLAQFSLVASSFTARSETASRIEFNRKEDRLAAEAKFKLDLRGSDFCREFSPILSLFGLKDALNEDFALEVLVHGRKNIVGIHSVGTASRTWKPAAVPGQLRTVAANDPAPVKLELDLYFNKLMRDTRDPRLLGALPFLTLNLHTFSTGEKHLDISVEANCTRRDGCEAIELIHLDKNGNDTHEPGIKIDADVAAFRDRFSPYIEVLLKSGFLTGKTGGDLLKVYNSSDATGSIHHEGRVKIKRVSSETANATDHVDFEFSTRAGFKAQSFEPTTPGAPGAPRVVGQWNEPKLSMELVGSYEQCLSTSPEEPDKLRLLNIDTLAVEGSLGRFSLRLNELDLLALPGLRTAANKTWTDALASMTLSGTISPQASLLAKAIGILDPLDPVSGTLVLEMVFDRAKDSLDLAKFDFKQSGDFYITSLSATGTLSKVRGISARLFPTQPNQSTLAERAAGWLDESGPSAFFDHLGKELRIQSLELDAKLFRKWVEQTFKTGDVARKIPSLFAGIRDKTWEPEGVWRAEQVQLARDLNYDDTWRLNGSFRSDFNIQFPPTDDGPGPSLSLTHPWTVALGLSLNKDGAASIHGDISFDNARLRATIPGLQFDFDKPANEPFKVMLEGCASTRGVLPTSIAKLNVSGKFGDFEMRNFLTAPTGPAFQFSVENFGLKSPAFECVGAVPHFDWRSDKLEARLTSPSLNLRGLPELWRLGLRNDQGAGKLKNAAFAYKGGLTALLSTLPPKLRPKIDPDDPRRFGFQPDLDAFELEGDLDSVRIDATPEHSVELGGRLRISANDISCKNFTAVIREWVPFSSSDGDIQKARRIQKFSIPKLHIKAADPKMGLASAFSTPGLPLEIRGDVECEKALTDEQLADLRRALKTVAPDALPTGVLGWPLIAKLFVNGGMKAPGVSLAGLEAAQFETHNVVFRDLKLSMPLASSALLNGRLKIEDAEYDFSKMAAKSSVGGGARGLRHSQRVMFTGGDLCQFIGGPQQTPARYTVCGKISAQGPFNGVDFKGMDRLSWSGALKIEFADFSIGAPIVPTENATAPLPWMEHFKNHAAGRGPLMARAAATDSTPVIDMSGPSPLPTSNAATVFDGFLACAELYFAKVCGVELPRMEFEPFSTTVRIDKGLAEFEPFELKGKGASAGFDIRIRNLKINLADETFADDALIYATALPQDAQDRMALQKWPAVLSQLFLTSMNAGRMPLRLSGPLAAPSVKFPWTDASTMARSALFGIDAITDAESLAKAREHLLRVWGKEDAALLSAAMLADRLGAGLPGTLSSRLTRLTLVDRAVKMPPKIQDTVALTTVARPETPLLSPLDSLKILLFAEPEVTPPPAPIPPLGTTPTSAAGPAPKKPDPNAQSNRNGKP
ncbi:MAG: FHA domain-containing protein [Planctomycetota bacterium]